MRRRARVLEENASERLVTDKDWVQWVDQNPLAFDEAMRDSSAKRKEGAKRLEAADADYPAHPRLQPVLKDALHAGTVAKLRPQRHHGAHLGRRRAMTHQERITLFLFEPRGTNKYFILASGWGWCGK